MAYFNPENPQWSGPLSDTAVIYYPGAFSTQVHAVKYIGQERLLTTTREKVSLKKKGILTIPPSRLWMYPEISEVDRHTKSSFLHWLFRRWLNLGGIRTEDAPSKPVNYVSLFNGNESGSVTRSWLDFSKMSFGQKTDIVDHKKKYDALVKQVNPDNIVLYGVSRGAAATFCAAATYPYKNIKLCILEGPPGSVSAAVKFMFPRFLAKFLYYWTWIRNFILGWQHEPGKENQTLAYVNRFPNHIPLVIVTSVNDEVVPQKSALNMANRVAANRIAARDRGESVAPVYVLQLQKAHHNSYFFGETKDGQHYQNFIHAVYKRHGLPFIEEFANQAESELDASELTQGPLQQQMLFQSLFKQERKNREILRQEALATLKVRVKELNDADKDAVIKICKKMPLYAKPIKSSWFYFFGSGENAAQKELNELQKKPPTR